MNKTIRFLLWVIPYFMLLFPSNIEAATRQIQCKVVGVSDGDTLTCLYQRKGIKVRLQYIDAPESAQPYGRKAKQALAELVFKKEVSIVISGYDRYQRALGVVYNEKRENVNLKLVELGMAWAYRQTKAEYRTAQAEAQRKRRGLWQDKSPINPAEWRSADKRLNSF